jgi:hypothetical protein
LGGATPVGGVSSLDYDLLNLVWTEEKLQKHIDLTDQCPSIEVGIRNVIEPETVHRFCSWHILHKLSTKWGFVENKGVFTDLVKDVVLFMGH